MQIIISSYSTNEKELVIILILKYYTHIVMIVGLNVT